MRRGLSARLLLIVAGFIAHTTPSVSVRSSAKKAATYGDHVKSISRVGAPWCCMSASHWKSSSGSGGWARNWCALRLKTRRMRLSWSTQALGSTPKFFRKRESELYSGQRSSRSPRNAQLEYGACTTSLRNASQDVSRKTREDPWFPLRVGIYYIS